jgi:hypothetical protein
MSSAFLLVLFSLWFTCVFWQKSESQLYPSALHRTFSQPSTKFWLRVQKTPVPQWGHAFMKQREIIFFITLKNKVCHIWALMKQFWSVSHRELIKLFISFWNTSVPSFIILLGCRERIIFITHLKPLQPKTAITDDFWLVMHPTAYHSVCSKE